MGEPDVQLFHEAAKMTAAGKIAIIIDRIGPYHDARLRACAARGPIFAIEIARKDQVYAWRTRDSAGDYPQATLIEEKTPGYRPILAANMRKALDRERPAAVAINGWSCAGGLTALLWCGETGTPAIIMSDSRREDAARSAIKEGIKKRIVACASAGFVAGGPQSEYLESLGMPRSRIAQGYDVVDNQYFESGADAARKNAAAERARLGLPRDYFLCISRFVERKNLLLVIDAFAAYRQQAGPAAWPLVLAGDGDQRSALEQRIASHGLGQHVLLPGFLNYPDLPALYGLAHAFIISSFADPWGLVVNEAMAAGLPVLVSNQCGCARDLVEPAKNGFTFDPRNAAELAGLLQRVSADPGACARMGIAARDTISHWGLDRFADSLARSAATAIAHGPVRVPVTTRLLITALSRHVTPGG